MPAHHVREARRLLQQRINVTDPDSRTRTRRMYPDVVLSVEVGPGSFETMPFSTAQALRMLHGYSQPGSAGRPVYITIVRSFPPGDGLLVIGRTADDR